MALEYAAEDLIPEGSKDQYESFAKDINKPDELVWIDKDVKAARLESFKFQGDLTAVNNKLIGFQAEQVKAQDKIKADAALALSSKIAELQASGNVTEAEKIKQQVLQSELEQQKASFNELNEKFTNQTAAIDSGKIHSRAQTLAAEFADPKHQELVTLGLEQRAKMVDGVMVMHDHEGKAVHYDKNVYLAMLNNDPVFKGFAKTAVTNGGLNPQGGATTPTSSSKPYDQMTLAEKATFLETQE